MNMEKQTLKLKAFLVAMVTQDPINKNISNQPDCRFFDYSCNESHCEQGFI